MEEEVKKTFEENLSQLELIVSYLEKGDLKLDDAIEKFKKGIELSKICNKQLEQAEKQINILVQNEDGEIIEEEFVTNEE